MPCKGKRKPYDTRNKFNLPIKTTTRDGKREYMRLYMMLKRKGVVADLVGLKIKGRGKK